MSVYRVSIVTKYNWLSVCILYVTNGPGWWTSVHLSLLGYLKVDGTDSCLFRMIKRSMSVLTATAQGATYFPNRYFRRIVVNYMVNYQQQIYENKYLALMSLYDIEEAVDSDRGWTPPLSYKQYLKLLLQWDFWVDELVLYTISCMWCMKITVLNMRTLQEYRICHDRRMDNADIIITFNAVNHFNAAGGWMSIWPSVTFCIAGLTLCVDECHYISKQCTDQVSLCSLKNKTSYWLSVLGFCFVFSFQSWLTVIYWNQCWSVWNWSPCCGNVVIPQTLRRIQLLVCLVRMRQLVWSLNLG